MKKEIEEAFPHFRSHRLAKALHESCNDTLDRSTFWFGPVTGTLLLLHTHEHA